MSTTQAILAVHMRGLGVVPVDGHYLTAGQFRRLRAEIEEKPLSSRAGKRLGSSVRVSDNRALDAAERAGIKVFGSPERAALDVRRLRKLSAWTPSSSTSAASVKMQLNTIDGAVRKLRRRGVNVESVELDLKVLRRILRKRERSTVRAVPIAPLRDQPASTTTTRGQALVPFRGLPQQQSGPATPDYYDNPLTSRC